MPLASSRSILYVGLDGAVLIPSREADPFLKAAITAYAKPFLHWAVGRFKVRWLSRRSPREAFYVAGLLGLPEDAVPVAGFRRLRCEAIPHGENFFWLDGPLTVEETAWLGARGPALYIGVDPRVGVTPDHKRVIERLTQKAE